MFLSQKRICLSVWCKGDPPGLLFLPSRNILRASWNPSSEPFSIGLFLYSRRTIFCGCDGCYEKNDFLGKMFFVILPAGTYSSNYMEIALAKRLKLSNAKVIKPSFSETKSFFHAAL